MARVIFTVLLSITILALAITASTKDAGPTTQVPMTKENSMTTPGDQDMTIDIDAKAIFNMCNESFRIEMAYLDALNTTGSFMDETDRTPKCFIRCVLENSGILSEDAKQFDTARAAAIFAGERNGVPMDDLNDMTSVCAADRQESCPCDRAYKFLRCVMSMEIEKYETPKE